MLLDPTKVVFNSFPVVVVIVGKLVVIVFCETLLGKPATTFKPPPAVTPITLVAAAGDCDGLGWKTTVPALGLPLVNWCIDCLRPGVTVLRSLI